MSKIIKLKEGFEMTFLEMKNANKQVVKIQILELSLFNALLAQNWMDVTDFVALLESAARNKLGTANCYQMYGTKIQGMIIEGEYKVVVSSEFSKTVEFNVVQAQQISSKLNKMLHMADKLTEAIDREFRY